MHDSLNDIEEIAFEELKIEELKKRLRIKNKQYTALNKQYVNTLQADQKILLENQMGILEIEILELERQIKGIPKNQNWQDNLHKINFKEVSSTLNNIFSKIQNGGAALFLLQDYNLMGGKWCVALIKDLLRQKSGKFKPYQIEFLPHEILGDDELTFKIGSFLDIESSIANLPERTSAIIDKMCESFQIGSTVFIELRFENNLVVRDGFMSWFINNFWQPLVKRLDSLIDERPRVKFVFLIAAAGSLPPSFIGYSLTCTEEEYDSEKILELRLENWTEEEIIDWLFNFSNLDSTREGYERMAQSIYYSSTRGVPLAVHTSLLKSLN